MRLYIFGNQKKPTRHTQYSAEINAEVDVLLWQISHPEKGDEHFGYKGKDAAAILLDMYAASFEVDERDRAFGLVRIVLGECGFTPVDQQREIEGMSMRLPESTGTSEFLHSVA